MQLANLFVYRAKSINILSSKFVMLYVCELKYFFKYPCFFVFFLEYKVQVSKADVLSLTFEVPKKGMAWQDFLFLLCWYFLFLEMLDIEINFQFIFSHDTWKLIA